MAIVRKWLGAVAGPSGSPSPIAGGSFVPGDALIIVSWADPGSMLATQPSGWSKMDADSNEHQVRGFGFISLTGSESIPPIVWSSGTVSRAAVFCYSGVDPNFTTGGGVSDRGSSSTQNITMPAVSRTPTVDGCLCIYHGIRKKTSVTDATIYSPPSGFNIALQSTPAGTTVSYVCGEWIQTTATNIPSGVVFTGSVGGDTSSTMLSALFILQPAASANLAYTDSNTYQEMPPRGRPYPAGIHEFWQVPIQLTSLPPPKPVASVSIDPPPRGREFPASLRAYDQNLLESTLAGQDRVLVPVDWDYGFPSAADRLPACFRDENQGFTVNEITQVTTFPPYQEYNWPVPQTARRLNNSFEAPMSLPLYGKDKILNSGPQNNMWDPPKGRPVPTTNLSWEQSGLALFNSVPLKPPLSQSDWPVPVQRRPFTQDFVQGTPETILSFLTVMPKPQGSQEVPRRRSFVPDLYSYVYSGTLPLMGPGVKPVGGASTEFFFRRSGASKSLYEISVRSNFLTPTTPTPPTTPGQVAGPGGRTILLPKKLGETVNRPFDFISRLGGGEKLVSATVSASVYSGIDLNPQAIIYGGPSISGTIVIQALTGGVVGVVYEVLCKAVTSLGQTLEIAAFWVVEPDLP